MKRIFLVFLTAVLLTGCAGENSDMEQALEFRSLCLGAKQLEFEARVCADYSDHMERFTLDCMADDRGTVSFCVKEPEVISEVSGHVSGKEGALNFEDEMIAFPLMADETLSPVSAPWLMVHALREGAITACAREEDCLHLSIDADYGDEAYQAEIWVRDRTVQASEISWQGRRLLSMEISQFTFM